jgi:hypothetical protein
MPESVLKTQITQPKSAKPVLIIDKKGILGVQLARKISQDFVVILVTGRAVTLFKNLIVIPYKRTMPLIPDNTFTQIIVISNGEQETFAMLPSLSKKAEEGKSRIAFIINLRLGTEALYKRLLQRYSTISAFVIGDMFGGDLWEANLVNDFLLQIKKHSKIVIPNTGLYKTYPVFRGDVIERVLHETFMQHLEKRVYLLFPRHAVTALSVARHLQQLYPEIGIDFLKTTERSKVVSIPEDGTYILPDPYPLSKKLAEVDVALKKEPVFMLPQGGEYPYKKPLAFVIFGFILLFLMPFLATAAFALFGFVLLDSGKHQLEKGSYKDAAGAMSAAKNAFVIAEETGDTATSLAAFVGLRPGAEGFMERLRVGEQVATAGELLIQSYLQFAGIQSGESTNPKGDFTSGMNDLRQSMILARALSKNEKVPDTLKDTLLSYAPVMQLVTATGDLYPELLGFSGEKKYLVLFQNNMELRPGGGFIGSYGLLTMHNGRVKAFTIHNVYDADGQLKTHVEPPYALRRYMGVKHLYLRDSNFSVDFIKNAGQAAYLLELETGVKTDGVIAVDMHFFRSLFEVTGQVKLPAYNETVNAGNVYLTTQRHAEKDSFPGSRQKQDFLKALFQGFTTKLSASGGMNPQLAKKVAEGIQGKHVMVVVLDKGAQNVLTLNNLSGSLWDARKSDALTINDTFGLNEANIGMNKVNYYVHRSLQHTVTMGKSGEITGQATITYVNTAKRGSEFGGPYKTYVRAILPQNAEILGIAIDGEEQPLAAAVTDSNIYEVSRFVPPPGIEIHTTEEDGKQVSGFLLLVPEDSTRKVSLRYRLLQAVPDTTFVYDMLFFKQPGAAADPYIFTLSYPEGYKVIEKSNNLEQKGDTLSAFGPLDGDKTFSVKFAK